ncbi:uncharacterized protein LOC128743732 [Sabethes cyaneus]|uniref:uncharacterized protein LOC128743732 n=1 Tax=Sabethes cyaneus TaxID=53552 RepID=UPI00237E36F2|nr:uncharacterized protein LOC128743732 [Sabethes cyaneus]
MDTTSKVAKQSKRKTRSKLKNETPRKPTSYLYDSRNENLPVFGVIVQWDAKKTYSTNALKALFATKLSTGPVCLPAADERKMSLKRKQMPYFRRSGPNKGMIMFKTMQEANDFSQKEDPDYYCFIPLSFVVVVGVAVMPASNFNFLNFKSASDTCEILQWRKQKLADKKIRITVAIRGSTLPPKLNIRDVEVPLEPYERKPVYCNRCGRYGHRKSNCLHKPRCDMCTGTMTGLIHFKSDCLNRKRKTSACFHCRENHTGRAVECSEYPQQCKYKSQLAKHNMDYLSLLEKEIIPAVRATSINSSRIWLD